MRRFVYGLILTAVTVLISLALATGAFGSEYYLAQLLPIFLVTYLLAAWLVYLRRDGFISFVQRRRPKVDTLGPLQHGAEDGLPEQRISGEEMGGGMVVRDGLLDRAGGSTDAEVFWRESMYVFLWSACQLAAVAALLHGRLGIGAGL